VALLMLIATAGQLEHENGYGHTVAIAK